MINPLDIKNLNKISRKKTNISTLAYNIEKKQDYENANIVKLLQK